MIELAKKNMFAIIKENGDLATSEIYQTKFGAGVAVKQMEMYKILKQKNVPLVKIVPVTLTVRLVEE